MIAEESNQFAPNIEATAELQTRTGYRFHVRPAGIGDEGALAAFFEHVSHEDLRFRFLSGINKVDVSRIEAITHVDHRQTESFLAMDGTSDRIVASALLAADKELDTAEVAISIDQEFKGRGIGWTLLEHVARVARARGIKRLQSIEGRDNHAAIELEREMGFTARPCEGDATLIILEADLQA